MRKVSQQSWLNALARECRESRVPSDATFELSYGCNLACRHCLNPTHAALPRELSSAEIVRILGEIADLGVFEICFSGGEPFRRPDFFAIIRAARARGLCVSMNTNATLISKSSARRLRELNVAIVHVSLYGAQSSTYEAMTRARGSFALFQSGLEALSAAEVPFELHMPVTTINRDDVFSARELAKSYGVKFSATVEIYPRQDGDLAPLSCRLSPGDKLAVMRELGEASGGQCPAGEPPFFSCSCGQTQFAITPYGEMNLCTILPIPKYDLRKGSVREGWEVLKRTVDEARPGESYECPSCDLKDHCRQGRADSWLEREDLGACIPHYKELARLEKALP